MSPFFKLNIFFASFFSEKKPQEINYVVNESQLENFLELIFLLLKDGIVSSFEVKKKLKQDGISEHWRLVQRLLAGKGCECGKCNI